MLNFLLHRQLLLPLFSGEVIGAHGAFNRVLNYGSEVGGNFGFLVRDGFKSVHGETRHIAQQGKKFVGQLFVDLRHVEIMASFFQLNSQVKFNLVVAVWKRIQKNVARLQIIDVGIFGGVWALLPAEA